MNLAAFEALLRPEGQSALAAAAELAPSEEAFLAALTKLQKQFPAAVAKAALETVILREKARRKFTRAGEMYFTREALEQASAESVSRYRSERFTPFATAADLGCGIGGDTLGLAGRCAVTAVDADPLRLAMARRNMEPYGYGGRVAWLQGDVAQMPLPEAEALFFDPARRAGGRRKFSVRDYDPPLDIIRGWLARTPALGVKISPGVDLSELTGYDCETEFISDEGELKECALWFGPLKTAERRATVLPGPHTLLPDPAAASVVSDPMAYLYEPDPAVMRAGLVTTLAARLNAAQLDPTIAYLTADSLQPTPFARAFAVDEALPFQLKRLRQRLRDLGVGHVTVKKRGSPLEPEDLIRRLKLSGSESRVVFLTRVRGRPYVLIGRPAAG